MKEREIKIGHFSGKSPLPQSPPNSGFKESTRMETSMDSPASGSLQMDLSGASPALFRGGEEKLAAQTRSSKANTSKSKQSSFTKLRSVSRTPLQKKNKSGRKKDESESEGSSEVISVRVCICDNNATLARGRMTSHPAAVSLRRRTASPATCPPPPSTTPWAATPASGGRGTAR